jgi:periplasmic divalent cation tolerance protein
MKKIITYINDEQKADEITEVLLKEKLVACVNILPGKSSYWWKGNIEKTNEFTLMIKTKDSLVEETIDKIKEIHPYDLLAIEVIHIERSTEGVEEWIDEVTK